MEGDRASKFEDFTYFHECVVSCIKILESKDIVMFEEWFSVLSHVKVLT